MVAGRGRAVGRGPGPAATLSGCATAATRVRRLSRPEPASPTGRSRPPAGSPSPASSRARRRANLPAADLWSVATDGSDLVRLTDLPEFELFPAWSPDATRLVFSRLESQAEGDLWIIDADPTASDRHLRQLTEGPGLEAAAAWSPDGAWIAYVADWHNNASIWIRAADGSGEPRRVIDGNWPSWTPDGSRLLVTLGSDFKATTLAFVSVDGGEPEALPIQVPNASEGSVSPLGEIAFVSSENDYAGDPATWNEDIYTIGPDGRRGPTRIIDTPEQRPLAAELVARWRLVRLHPRRPAQQRSRIAIVVGTGEPRYLTDGSYDLFPAWRPDPAP